MSYYPVKSRLEQMEFNDKIDEYLTEAVNLAFKRHGEIVFTVHDAVMWLKAIQKVAKPKSVAHSLRRLGINPIGKVANNLGAYKLQYVEPKRPLAEDKDVGGPANGIILEVTQTDGFEAFVRKGNIVKAIAIDDVNRKYQVTKDLISEIPRYADTFWIPVKFTKKKAHS